MVADVTDTNPSDQMKADLLRYLAQAREALVWKLDGLDDYDIRRPLTPTGTNLLGLVKHTASVEAGYLGDTFGRPFPEPMPWIEPDAETDADMWATADESREWVTDLYRRVWAHSVTTVEECSLDTLGSVPWWPPEHREVTLHRVLVHVTAETQRHAGHADIVRETIDGAVGLRAANANIDQSVDWTTHRERLEAVARTFR